jgi:hypothetical protein
MTFVVATCTFAACTFFVRDLTQNNYSALADKPGCCRGASDLLEDRFRIRGLMRQQSQDDNATPALVGLIPVGFLNAHRYQEYRRVRGSK